MNLFIIHRFVLRSIGLIQLLLLTLALPMVAEKALANDEENIRRLLHLTEYIGADYVEAVRDGQVVNEAEFTEMIDFSKTAKLVYAKFRQQLPANEAESIANDLEKLEAIIHKKGSIQEVRALTNQVKQVLLAHASLQTAPTSAVDYAAAKELYALHCASCHGDQGHGDGPAGAELDPPPRDFHEQGIMDIASALRFYNVQLLGVDETGMISYKEILPESDLWSLSFYLLGMRYAPEQEQAQRFWEQLPQTSKDALAQAGLTLEFLSTKTDEELTSWLATISDKHISEHTNEVLAALRLFVPYTLAPTAVNSTKSSNDTMAVLEQVATHLVQTKKLVQEENFETAHNLLLDTYLEHFEKVEPLLSSRSRTLVGDIETLFIQARSHANKQDRLAATQSIESLQEAVNKAMATLDNQSDQSNLATTGDFIASFIIIFREGIEAFLIIAALLALLKTTNSPHLTRYVHGGWMAAIVAGFLTFLAMNYVWEVSGATKEVIEAVSSGLAAVVLIYISFWLLNNSERKRWEKMIKDKVTSTVKNPRNQIWTLAGVSFLAVYREAAETVLFYQALFAGSTEHAGIFSGLIVGLIVLGFICLAIYKLGLRLPLKTFFRATSALMILLAIVLTGKAFNELIEAGYIRPTTVEAVPRIDLLGIYPNIESLTAQCLLIAFCSLLVFWSLRQSKTAGAKN